MLQRICLRFFKLTKKLYILIIISLLLTYLVMNIPKYQKVVKKDKSHPLSLKYTVIHLDLKGSPPKLEYLRSQLPVWQFLGVNGILIEYEDMFPYQDTLVNLSAVNRYKALELQMFITEAAKKDFEVIPLIQTFGHMEHVLKLKEFEHLREDPECTDSICPSNFRSISLIEKMLKQIIEFHEIVASLNYIHIGCDEVFSIGKCHLCRSRGLDNTTIFLNHVERITGIVARHNPKTTVLIWDDMLRIIDPGKWRNFPNLGKVVPVYWDYQPNLKLNHVNLFRYRKHFGDIWTASAFKGAEGATAIIPDLNNRYLNHFTWLKHMYQYKFAGENSIFNFTGIILTGWSRYSHMDPICELLPVSIPSLFLNLLTVDAFKKGFTTSEMQTLNIDTLYQKHLKNKFSEILKCKKPVSFLKFNSSHCSFDGVDIYKALERLDRFKKYFRGKYYDDKESTAAFRYYWRQGNINRVRIQSNLVWGKSQLKNITLIEKELGDILTKYYDKHFIMEYVGLVLFEERRIIGQYMKELKKVIALTSWSRRYSRGFEALEIIANKTMV